MDSYNVSFRLVDIFRMCVYLNAVVAAQLLCIKSRAVDSMEGQFNSSWEQGGGLGEELIILSFHCDRFDEHGVTGIFVRFQFCLQTMKWSED